jgi:lipopolysaccharide exporter
MASLGPPGVAAVRWSVLASAMRFAMQLGAQVLLARMLGPQVFGLFGIGLVLLTFANFISGFGFGWSLLQRQDLKEEDIRFAWTWQLLAGLLAAAGLYGLAPWLAGVFRAPEALGVIRWLSLACVFQAAAAPATYLLQRALNFRALGLIQVGSYAAGYLAVGLPMAWAGAGVHALVAAWLVQTGSALLASYALQPHALRPLLWYPQAAQVMRTGRAVFFTNLVNWTLGNLDRLLIARLLNPTSLGLYNVAYNLATVPNTLLLGALQPAFMAAGAQLQDQRERLAAAYLQMLATLLVLGLPAFTVLALLSPDLVALLYGPAWQEAGPVLALLFAFMPAFVIWGISTPVLWNTGRPQQEFALQLPLIPLGALALWLAAPHGIAAAALAVGGLLLLRALVLVVAALRALRMPGSRLAPHALRGALLSAACAAAVWAGLRLAQPVGAPLVSLLAGSAPLLAALLVPWLRPQWCAPVLGEPCWRMVLRFAPRLARAEPLASSPPGDSLHPRSS